MHDMPESTMRDLDKDSYSAETGQDPRQLSSHVAGSSDGPEELDEGSIQEGTSTDTQDAATTIRLARERAVEGGPSGQG